MTAAVLQPDHRKCPHFLHGTNTLHEEEPSEGSHHGLCAPKKNMRHHIIQYVQTYQQHVYMIMSIVFVSIP